MAHVAERGEERLDGIEEGFSTSDEDVQATSGRLGHAPPNGRVDREHPLAKLCRRRAELVGTDRRHVDPDLARREGGGRPLGLEEDVLESRRIGEHGDRVLDPGDRVGRRIGDHRPLLARTIRCSRGSGSIP